MDCININYGEFFCHCISVKRNEDGFYFPTRFTEKQEKRYSAVAFTPYGKCPAGVSFEFKYSGDLPFSFLYNVIKNRYTKFGNGCFDIYENGILCESVEVGCIQGTGKVEYTPKTKGEVEIAIFLPLHTEIALGEFDIPDIKKAERKYSHKLLVIGDSVTQGLFALHPSLSLIPRISETLDCDYLNCSVGGDFLDAETIDKDNGFCPDTVLVCLGTNDMCFISDMEKIRSSAEKFFFGLSESYPQATVNLISPTWETEDSPIWKKELSYMKDLYFDIIELEKEFCLQYGINYIDGREICPHNREFFFDEIHPNDLGFSVMAQKLCRKLKLGKGI